MFCLIRNTACFRLTSKPSQLIMGGYVSFDLPQPLDKGCPPCSSDGAQVAWLDR